MNTHDHLTPAGDEAKPDYFVYFSVFMLAFWPVALVFGIVAYCFTRYDMRLFDLLIGLLAGWIALSVYRAKEQNTLAS